MLNFLRGRKTFIVAALTVAYGWFQAWQAHWSAASVQHAIELTLGGSGLGFLRAGINNAVQMPVDSNNPSWKNP